MDFEGYFKYEPALKPVAVASPNRPIVAGSDWIVTAITTTPQIPG